MRTFKTWLVSTKFLKCSISSQYFYTAHTGFLSVFLFDPNKFGKLSHINSVYTEWNCVFISLLLWTVTYSPFQSGDYVLLIFDSSTSSTAPGTHVDHHVNLLNQTIKIELNNICLPLFTSPCTFTFSKLQDHQMVSIVRVQLIKLLYKSRWKWDILNQWHKTLNHTYASCPSIFYEITLAILIQ